MYDIPQTGFLRLPAVLNLIPVKKTCWWEGVRSGWLSQAGQIVGPMHSVAG